MAWCLAPIFDLDPEENAWEPGEPAVLWTIDRRETPSPQQMEITVRYVLLWQNDGGYAADDSFGCGNDHPGDSSLVMVRATVSRWNRIPMVTLDSVQADTFVGHTFSEPRMRRLGSHPVVFPTAGKHHWYLWPGSHTDDVSGPGGCADPARGGRLVHPEDLTRFRHGYNARIDTSTSPFDVLPRDDDGNWPNLCALTRFGTFVPATRFQGFYLDDFGFPGFTYDVFFPDSSEDVSTPGAKLAHHLPADTDGDDLREVFDITPDGLHLLPPWDPCSLGAGGEDLDGDNLVGACDPDPAWFSPYVAGGSADFPNAVYRFGMGPWHGHDGMQVAWPRNGFLDRDRDGQVEGEDRCPSLPDWLADANAWGQDQNWPPGKSWKPTSPRNVNLGQMQRGDRCDPYPVATPEPSSGGSPCKHCGAATLASQGNDTMAITNTVTEGLSLNDTRRDNPNAVFASETLDAQSYRCACRPKVPGGPQPTIKECLDDATSDCFRRDVRPALQGQQAGRGWRSVEQVGCPREPDSYCGAYPIQAKPFEKLSSVIEWAWAEERSKYGPSSPTPHFAPDDFRESAPNDSAFTYVTWTQADISAPRFSWTKRAEALFHDPETLAHNAELLDVDSVESRRLRAGYTSVATFLKGKRDIICPDIDVSDPEVPHVRNVLRAGLPIGELRADRWGQRVYGVADTGPRAVYPAVDLRGEALLLGPEHDVAPWVKRRDGDRWSAFVRGNGRVVVAEVMR